MLTLTLLALLSTGTPASSGSVPPVPSCSCDISELSGPCGYDLDSCVCDDGHGWRTLWLYDETSGYCEEYRVILTPDAASAPSGPSKSQSRR